MILEVLFPVIVFQLDAGNVYVGGTPQHTSLCVVVVIEAVHKASFTWAKSGWSCVTEESFQQTQTLEASEIL